MPLTMQIDTTRWRAHQERTVARFPGIVPVIKGNGYGVGVARLAAEAARLGVDTVAVGSVQEATEVSPFFAGRILVLQPHHPAVPERALPADVGARAIRVVSSADAAARVGVAAGIGVGVDVGAGVAAGIRVGVSAHAGPGPGPGAAADAGRRAGTQEPGGAPPVVLELLTSLHRHGVPAQDLQRALEALDPAQVAGFGLHLPLPGGRVRDPGAEVERWISRLRDIGALPATVWLSHVGAERLAALRTAHPDVEFRPRIGTDLWLGDPAALEVTATVCDLHPIRRGQRYGYRGRRAPWDGHLVVLSGGTAHGLGLNAPRFVRGVRARLALGAEFGLAELNWTRGPYTIAGRRPMLAEPPHMQVSLVLLPASLPAPAIGTEVPVQVRKTTARVDRIVDVDVR